MSGCVNENYYFKLFRWDDVPQIFAKYIHKQDKRLYKLTSIYIACQHPCLRIVVLPCPSPSPSCSTPHSFQNSTSDGHPSFAAPQLQSPPIRKLTFWGGSEGRLVLFVSGQAICCGWTAPPASHARPHTSCQTSISVTWLLNCLLLPSIPLPRSNSPILASRSPSLSCFALKSLILIAVCTISNSSFAVKGVVRLTPTGAFRGQMTSLGKGIDGFWGLPVVSPPFCWGGAAAVSDGGGRKWRTCSAGPLGLVCDGVAW